MATRSLLAATAAIALSILAIAIQGSQGDCLGCGGLSGTRTSLTGAKWPPYPGAGQDYWAKRLFIDPAEGYESENNLRRRRTNPVKSRLRQKRSYLGFGGVVGKNLTPRTGTRVVGSAAHGRYPIRRNFFYPGRRLHG
eukprot:TRINITY_DN170_c0_g1_i7.p1 TRINITY_DN170_c0_g1~~TRINITY_DN170_c0_g1_i7.p1  ORF type:complete len:138 (+),score=20.09 TRINITY_DN170_c0_g1_i7:190-603(+)